MDFLNSNNSSKSKIDRELEKAQKTGKKSTAKKTTKTAPKKTNPLSPPKTLKP